MASLLNQLPEIESAVMLYVADELSAADRAEVERRVAKDPAWRAALDELQAATASINVGLIAVAKDEVPAGFESAAKRNAVRSMNAWANQRRADLLRSENNTRRLPMTWWAYPLAAAAVMALAFGVWWKNLPDPNAVPPSPSELAKVPAMTEGGLAVSSERDRQERWIQRVDFANRTFTPAESVDLVSAEHELNALTTLSDAIQ